MDQAWAVDSTGFSTSVYRRWYDAKYGKEMTEHGWLKAHAMVGVTTNIIAAMRVTEAQRTTLRSCRHWCRRPIATPRSPRSLPRRRRHLDAGDVAYLGKSDRREAL